MNRFVLENRFHLLVVLFLIATQFFIKDLWALYYRLETRPNLVEQGYQSCAGYVPVIARHEPPDCDLVKVDHSQGRVDEHYFSKGGAQEAHVVSADGTRLSSSFEMRANQASMALPMIAFVVLGFALMHKIIRTGKFTSWSLMAEKNDRAETVLRVYAWPVSCASILFGLIGR